MTTLCPYCKSELTGEAALPPMRDRMIRIYRTALEAGPEGIATPDLLVRMYRDDQWPTPGGFVVLRVMICEINKIINPLGQRIVNKRGRYWLVSIDDQKVQPEANP